MNKPKISVIVPVYNTEKYLNKCVDSILAQSYDNLEILLVDDGSTDSSASICDAYAADNVNVRVIHKLNGGSSSARNVGIKEAKGDYLGFVDSDDFISADMYEKMALEIENGTEIIQTGRDEIDAQGNYLPDICETPGEKVVYSSTEFMRELLLHKGDCSFCTKIVPKALFDGKGFPEGLLNEDFNLLFKMLMEETKTVSLPFKGYHVFYRLGSNSRKDEKGGFSRVFADCVDNADMVYEYASSQKTELKSVALRFGVFQRIEYLLHIPIGQMTNDNLFYKNVVRWLRKHFFGGLFNNILTLKNKLYMTLFVIAPRGVRIVHAKKKGFDI